MREKTKVFRMLLLVKKKQCPLAAWGTTGQGAPRPLAGTSSLHPTREVDEHTKKQCPRGAWGTKGCVPTGAMKTKKRADERIFSLTASFLPFSPDAQASGGWRFAAQPVGAAVPQSIRNITIDACKRVCAWRRGRSQFAMEQSAFANGFVRGGGAAPNSQWNNRHLPTGLCVLQVIPHASAGSCLFATPTTSAIGSRDEIPGGAQG